MLGQILLRYNPLYDCMLTALNNEFKYFRRYKSGNKFCCFVHKHLISETLFAFTAAGVVQCGGRKTPPRTPTTVQFLFYFWSFEISVNILFPLAFVAGSLQGHWWGFISRNFVVKPIFFLMTVFIALKRNSFFDFDLTERTKNRL